MLKAVLDTNVLVSGLLKRGRGGIPDQILRQIAQFQLCLSEEILEETRRVLHYPRIQKRHGLADSSIAEYLGYLRAMTAAKFGLAKFGVSKFGAWGFVPSPTLWVGGIPTVDVIKDDPDDNIVLACALKANADYIVSGDLHLKELKSYRGIRIVPPAEFLNILKG